MRRLIQKADLVSVRNSTRLASEVAKTLHPGLDSALAESVRSNYLHD